MSEVRTLTLSEFLLQRIAEDEAMADRSVQVGDKGAMLVTFRLGQLVDAPESPPLMLIHPSRVLAECEAKRRAIEAAWADQWSLESEVGHGKSREQMSAENDNPPVIRWLATPYASHPDYREEWRP